MAKQDPQADQSKMGVLLDAWIPRLLKLLGLVGVGMSIALALVDKFDPVLFGGSLMAASGGYVGDALVALKPGAGKE